MSRPKYSNDHPECPKCGQIDWSVRWLRGDEEGLLEPEWLCYTCSCGFSWETLPADASEKLNATIADFDYQIKPSKPCHPEEPLSCPWCKTIPTVIEYTNKRGDCFRVRCLNQSCPVQPSGFEAREKQHAITMWNERG